MIIFETNGTRTSEYLYAKGKLNLGSYFTPHTQINLEWIINLNVKVTIVIVLKGNIGENICNLGLVNNFFIMTKYTNNK